MRLIRLGTSGWSYAWWRGLFYPEELPAREWLPFYAGTFDTVEINMTFYRFPTASTLKAWLERTPRGFCFSLKAPKTITHYKRLKDVAREVEDFYRLAAGLGPKLGCILFQLPPTLRADFSLLEEFAAVLSPEFTNVIEFRDPGWYDGRTEDILRARKIVFAGVSSEKMPPEIPETAGTAYVRFHGLAGGHLYEYTDKELRGWAAKIQALRAKSRFVYFNNDGQAHAVFNALRLKEILEE